jgi:DNA (cytosine-5)-methyltransferase 1
MTIVLENNGRKPFWGKGRGKVLTPNEALSQIYFEALRVIEGKRLEALANSFSDAQFDWLSDFTDNPERHKGVLTVLITCLVQKVIAPEQDIRLHLKTMSGGYSRRFLDTKYVTPFLREQGYPGMRENSWSNRSLEQPYPYDKNYPGKITPFSLKLSFLSLLEDVQSNPSLARDFLVFLFAKLERFRRSAGGSGFVRLPVEFTAGLSVVTIVEMLETHFNAKYRGMGGSARLPVLALYSLYQCLIPELARYKGKSLLPLKSPASATSKSGTVGYIVVVNSASGQAYEGIEIKFEVALTLNLVQAVAQKISLSTVERYYLISTATTKPDEQTKIEKYLATVKAEHGFELFVDEVLPVLNYYLRLISDPAKFLDYYALNLEQHSTIKAEHRLAWISILQSYSLSS